MIDHMCPICETSFEAEPSPPGVPIRCPECKAFKAQPVEDESEKEISIGLTSFIILAFCLVTPVVLGHSRDVLAYNCFAMAVVYLVSLPLCITAIIKERGVSRVLATIGLCVIALITMIALIGIMSVSGGRRY
ncbi:MAG: hypothetical protein HN350_06555 [Phycisphaerales bacterium]|jgi:hypothetical protein|nr:hypothetical protein [Phycisphaerales bacterium]